jgi:hypothetical protein
MKRQIARPRRDARYETASSEMRGADRLFLAGLTVLFSCCAALAALAIGAATAPWS